jgi:hypothetical protein
VWSAFSSDGGLNLMSPSSIDDAKQKKSAILDEIERIGIKAETDGRDLNQEEVARIETLSRKFDACEETLGHVVPGRSPSSP